MCVCITHLLPFSPPLQTVLPTSSPDDPDYGDDLERAFIYSLIWTCGGFLTKPNKLKFESWWRTTFSSCSSPERRFPRSGTLWDYYTTTGSHGFLSWGTSSGSPQIPSKTAPSPPFIPTTRSAAVTHLVKALIGRGIPVLIDGGSGSGKTALVSHLLQEMGTSPADMKTLHVYCNLLTSAEGIWNQILDFLEWDWGKKYTPKDTKRLLCFIDDIHNMEVCCAKPNRQLENYCDSSLFPFSSFVCRVCVCLSV